MTTVAAVARHGTIVMAGDSLTRVYDRPIRDGIRKVLRLPVGDQGQECLIGISGDGALGDILTHELSLEPAPDPDQDLQPWAAEVVWAVTRLAAEHSLTEDGQLNGSLLLGFRGRLWTLANSFAIPIHDGIAAIGSGEGPAMGVLDLLLEQGTDLTEAVRTAMRVAIGRDVNSDGPVYLELLTAMED